MPAENIRYYSEDIAIKEFADLQKQLVENENNINVLESAKEKGTTSYFLMLRTPELFFRTVR
jgi:hypothetical protein